MSQQIASPIVEARSIEEIQNIVHHQAHILPWAGRSKPALSQTVTDAISLNLGSLAGILEYEPGEYTFTALAGTPLSMVEAALAKNGQYMPFDPPLVQAGATLGGTVAAGLSGSGRYRYGGVRDFLIGIRFVDGQGRLVRGGGKVVKNAAGFDLPKLMVGSLGRFGVLVEVSFKVFPRPQSYATLCVAYPDLTSALAGMHRAASARFDLDALDLWVEQPAAAAPRYTLTLRLGGWAGILGPRLSQLRSHLGSGELLEGESETNYWQDHAEFRWAPLDWTLVKVATSVASLPALESELVAANALRRYSVGGNLTWIAWPGTVRELDEKLTRLKLAGLVLRGAATQPRLGLHVGQDFAQRIKQALDPQHKFLEL
jgi:glycolate oxidase FAD binding subunit